ncbi:methionyl-tRNA formyltransferase [Candidatus Aerophobetes bacterium]|uniref:Methionyl-tRNA formyltransferase n=1 Tax=Aerophobetes bacterium TaxID=2030807 RepID=A0A523V1G1_UNCAE|nr:MAG: methionyl-tRNA formyltransferase [Candidatus Aerophobetes bacterium]
MRILFMGTPEFACPSLGALIKREQIVGVVTQPDRPVGRGRRVIPSPVKGLAEENHIPVYQPQRVRDLSFLEEVRKIQPDLIVVVAFGQILPPSLLVIPKIYAINLHPSLLPRYRGPAPIPWVIIKGERETGLTVQKIEAGVDEGKIILQKKVVIKLSDIAKDLEKRLAVMGAALLEEAVRRIKEGCVSFLEQDEEKVGYAPKITKDQAEIDWKRSCLDIHNLVRGLNPYPGAFTLAMVRAKMLKMKIWRTDLLHGNFREAGDVCPGTIVKIEKEKGFWVRGGDGNLLIKEVQLPNRNSIGSYDFIKGYSFKEGDILGRRI